MVNRKRQLSMLDFVHSKKRSLAVQVEEEDATSPGTGNQPDADAVTEPLESESQRGDYCGAPGLEPPVDILMRDGWQLRAASLPGGRLISWNIGLQGFWNVQSAIVRLCSDSCPSVIMLQDLKISMADRKKVIRACRRIAPVFGPAGDWKS